jgi:hypothetical protein
MGPGCPGARESEPEMNTPEAALRSWLNRAEELELLVLWLAMPYGENQPIFATALPDGRVLETGVKLQALYRQVVGEKQWTHGIWVQCPCCSQMYVQSETLETVGPPESPGVAPGAGPRDDHQTAS